MSMAQERAAEAEAGLEELEIELEEKIDLLDEKYRIENYEVERFSLRPKKSDIVVEECAVVWKVS